MIDSLRNGSFDNSDTEFDVSAKTLLDKGSGLRREQVEVVSPATRADLKEVITRCGQVGRPFSVISGGRNWGYGGALPVRSNTCVISLRRLDRILDFNSELGILHVEAGVTQGRLEQFLAEHGHDYYVPNTGAGPDGSLVGNALERGFGMAPIEDHAGALLSVSGLLPDGTEFSSSLSGIDPLLGACFPAGIGPNLTALAPQSSWLIVTDVEIQLAKRQRHQELAMVPFQDEDWPRVIAFLQAATSRSDLPFGGYKILHRAQVSESTKNANWVQRLTTTREWTLMFFFRCEPALAGGFRKETRKLLKKRGLSVRMWKRSKIENLIWILGWLKQNFSVAAFESVRNALCDLNEFFRLGDGHTSLVGHRVKRDHQGLIWLSPLCPMTAEHVARLRKITQSWSRPSPLSATTWTWTVLNSRTLALVMPLVFPADTPQTEVWRDYHEKLETLCSAGFTPYRFPIECMDFVRDKIAPDYFRLVARVEKALDPDGLFNAGRYS
ncbi:hypothetical protein BH10BDE1_BH10BDE1_17820 [soil metagenome]